MTYGPQELSSTYWQELRSYETTLFERNRHVTPQMYPEFEAAEIWSSGMVEPIGPNTIAYSAKERIGSHNRIASLALYGYSNMGKADVITTYALDLRPGREQVRRETKHVYIAKTGVSEVQPDLSAVKLVSNKFKSRRLLRMVPGLVEPSLDDYVLIHEQLERGATGVFVRWSPTHDMPDEQR